MTACKPLLHDLISQDPKKWSGIIGVSEPTIAKLVSGKGPVRLETAEKMLRSANEHTGNAWTLEDAFDVSKLRGVESDRSKVIYEYGAAPLSEYDKAGLIRLLLEGKFDGFSVRDVLLLLLVVGLILFAVSLYAFFF